MPVTGYGDIITDLRPHIHKYRVNASVIAGALVYHPPHADPEWVEMCYNETHLPCGVALQSNSSGGLVSVVCPPAIVYLEMGSTSNISAGCEVKVYSSGGTIINISQNSANPSTQQVAMVGLVLGFHPSISSLARVQLRPIMRPNMSVDATGTAV